MQKLTPLEIACGVWVTSKNTAWKEIVVIVHDALTYFDEMLSEANVPITDRPARAFETVRHLAHMAPGHSTVLIRILGSTAALRQDTLALVWAACVMRIE
jgi:hypothetical protein